jgi:hypothetical protein
MKLAVMIDAKAAVKAGKNAAGIRVVEFDPADLTPEERDTLAAKCRETHPDGYDWRQWSGSADLYIWYGPGPTRLIEPTLDDLKRVLGEALAKRRKEAEEAAARQERERAGRAERDAQLAAGPVEGLLEQSYDKTWSLGHELRSPDEYPLCAAHRAQAEAERDRRNAELAAERERQAAEEAARKAKAEAERKAGLEVLAAWVREHGSELARARLEEGYGCWVSAAHDDYAAAVAARVAAGLTPADAPDGESVVEYRKCPTLAEIRTLREARGRVAEGDRVVVDLKRVRYDFDADEYGEKEEPLTRTELWVCVTCPDGFEAESFYLIPGA